MLSHLFRILIAHISPTSPLILALSGGPDSTALFHVLMGWGARPVVAHVNHGIRGKESDEDEAFVCDLAKKHGLTCEVKRVKLAGKTGQEELGRAIRREFFEKLLEKHKARWILTAHTEDDQLETMVFNFLRGSGPAGLAGMKMVDGHFFKPLLHTPKSEILAYLKSRKLPYRIDRTNKDTQYRRNFIRKKILPLCEKVNPEFRKTLIRNGEIFRGIEDWLEAEAARFLSVDADDVIASDRKERSNPAFSAKKFLALAPAVQNAVLQLMFRKFSRQPYRLPSAKIGEIRRLAARNIGNKRIYLGNNKEILLRKGTLEWRKKVW